MRRKAVGMISGFVKMMEIFCVLSAICVFRRSVTYPGQKFCREGSGHMDSVTYKEIKNLFDDYIEMYSSRNDLLTNHFSPDFSGFAGGSDVLVKDMEEWIAVTRQDFAQVKDRIHIGIKDLAIQSLSEDVAVATSFFTIKLPIEDDYFSRETVRLVLIFHKAKGQMENRAQ